MKKNLTRIIVIWMVLLGFAFSSFAQGISRSTGLGLRFNHWQEDRRDNDFFSVTASGGGGSLYFFSRLKENWFFETSIGGTGEAKIGPGVESTSLVPFLFGLRRDLLSPKHASSYQPYLGFGAGTYWISHDEVNYGVRAELDTRFGVYLGGGLNVILKDWFALNCDIKYHLTNFDDTALEDYTGLDFGVGCAFMWGRKPESFRIEEIKVVVQDIYPAYYQFYNTYPLALVTVKNTSNYPIEVNIRSTISDFSERPGESGFVKIDQGKTKDVPVYAILGTTLLENYQRKPAVIDLELEVRAGATQIKTMSANVMIHSRNAWNGDVDKLGFFVTPDDEDIRVMTREIVRLIPEVEKKEVKNLLIAEALFNELNKQEIQYQSDPNIPFYQDDRVQFADETRVIGTGDCDDLTVLYASLLESQGINTAFVEVQDPLKDMAHLYLMFNTGLSPEQGELISTNEKRYVLREKVPDQKEIWIPIETTLVDEGFEEAWGAGAKQYLQEGVMRSGLVENWVKIIDVQ